MLLSFLKNPLTSKNLAREDFRDLLQGHLSRLTSQNTGGQYTAMISSLQPHYTSYNALPSCPGDARSTTEPRCPPCANASPA